MQHNFGIMASKERDIVGGKPWRLERSTPDGNMMMVWDLDDAEVLALYAELHLFIVGRIKGQ